MQSVCKLRLRPCKKSSSLSLCASCGEHLRHLRYLRTTIPHILCAIGVFYDATVLGTTALLKAIRGHKPNPRMSHASSSLVFGQPETFTQDESTPYRPTNPYVAPKAVATQMVSIYRKAYGLLP